MKELLVGYRLAKFEIMDIKHEHIIFNARMASASVHLLDLYFV